MVHLYPVLVHSMHHNCLCKPTSDPSFNFTTNLSVVEMVTGKVPYQRLQQEGGSDEGWEERPQGGLRSSRSSFRLRRFPMRKRFRFRFRFKVLSLRRLVMRKARFASAIRFSCGKLVKRMKEGREHFGDLFAGNYMFMQVSPTPLKCHDKSFSLARNGLASGHSLPRTG